MMPITWVYLYIWLDNKRLNNNYLSSMAIKYPKQGQFTTICTTMNFESVLHMWAPTLNWIGCNIFILKIPWWLTWIWWPVEIIWWLWSCENIWVEPEPLFCSLPKWRNVGQCVVHDNNAYKQEKWLGAEHIASKMSPQIRQNRHDTILLNYSLKL